MRRYAFIIAILFGMAVGWFGTNKALRMYHGGHFGLLPCVYIFDEWRKLPLWPCPPAPEGGWRDFRSIIKEDGTFHIIIEENGDCC